MDKKLVIIGGIVILALIIIGIFVFTGNNDSKENADTNLTNTELQEDLDSLNQEDIALDSTDTSEIIEVD